MSNKSTILLRELCENFRDVIFPAFAGISALMKFQILAFLFILSTFWRLLVQIHILFQAFSFRPAYIPEKLY